jgi:hypothetical protein
MHRRRATALRRFELAHGMQARGRVVTEMIPTAR